MDIHSMKYELGKWLTTEKSLPLAILMNQPTYQEYCMTNRNLPSTPPYEKGDSLHHVHGIPIDEDIKETLEEMPSLPKLLRQVHKAGFWHGAEFGRKVFLEIMEDERKTEVLNNAEEVDRTS